LTSETAEVTRRASELAAKVATRVEAALMQ
jgi:hypothetical protein